MGATLVNSASGRQDQLDSVRQPLPSAAATDHGSESAAVSRASVYARRLGRILRSHPTRHRGLNKALWCVTATVVLVAALGATFRPSPPSATGTAARPAAAQPQAPGVSAVPADVSQAGPASALALLATVVIKGRAPMTGYTRDQFGPAWTDDNDDPMGHNGCDTRNDILRRDLLVTAFTATGHGCAVLTGTLADPYTGRTIAFARGGSSSAVQIDHVVPLGDAWQSGAQQWPVQERIDLANDPLDLLAVSSPQNEAKGDGDAATWLPANRVYRCAYVARQVAVKARYELWMTRAEHDAIASILGTCPTQPAPAEAGAGPVALSSSVPTAVGTPSAASPPAAVTPVVLPPVVASSAIAPTVAPPTVATSEPAPVTSDDQPATVTPGAFCATEGATGVSKTGRPERCQTSATDSRLRWRAA